MDREVLAFVAARARQLRKDRGIPVDELAKKIGVAEERLHRFENAEERIELDRLVCLVNVLGVPLTSLYMLEEGKA